ncbi:MAG: hypothetical protein ABI905_09485 [Betaproteobacteria bacterium]
METLEWGLSQLGHDVSYAVNSYRPSARNIVFGAQVLPAEKLEKLPRNSVAYNFEQIPRLNANMGRTELPYFAQLFEIWDYSLSNCNSWRWLGVNNPICVPVGYAPVLTRIPKPPVQDIDILMYGMAGDKRLTAFHRLSSAGLSTVFVSGLYGKARDALIARSKIVLNINRCDYAQIFEIVRVSYLFANRKAVVATLDEDTVFEADVNHSLKFTTMDQLVNDCAQLLDSELERTRLENIGYENFVKRDIRKILRETPL